MIDHLERRFLSLVLALVMVISFVPFDALAVTLFSTTVLDGKVSVSGDGTSGLGTGENTNGTIAITAKAEKDSCSGDYTAKAHTITIANATTSETLTLEFAYEASSFGGFTVAGVDKASAPKGTWGGQLAPGASVTIVLTSKADATVANLTLSGFALQDSGTRNVTVKAGTNGTVKVNGTAITADNTVQATYAEGVQVAATASSGYVFLGWVDANGNIVATAASTTIQPKADMTVQAMFVAKNTQGYWMAGNKIHSDLNAAISAAQTGDGIVILLKDATLPAGTYTIPAGVKVLIPHDDAKTHYGADPDLMPNKHPWVNPTPYCTLTMASGAKIVVNGSLELAAKHHVSTGVDSVNYGGAIHDKYGLIKLEGNASIDVNGTLYAWGIITGTGVVTAYSGGTIYEKMQVTDYRGGRVTSAIALTHRDKKLFPFNQYYCQNVEALEVLHAGSTLMAHAGVVVDSVEESTIAFVGDSSAMFGLVSGYVTKKYDAASDRLLIDLYGNASLNSIGLAVGGQSINSSSYRLGINNNVSIHIHSGVTTINQDLILQPGATVTVDREATLYNTKEVFVMDAEDWGTFARSKTLMPIKWSYQNGTTVKRTSVTDAIVDINGTVISAGQIYSSGSQSIISSEKTGVYILQTSANSSATLNQVTNNDINSIGLLFAGDAWTTIAHTAAVLVNGDTSTVTAEGVQYDAFIYDAFLDKWVKKNIYNGGAGLTATITYDPNGGTGTAYGETVDYLTTAGTFAQTGVMAPLSLAIDENTVPFAKEGYTFAGWNTAANGTGVTAEANDYVAISDNYTLYAQWTPKTYTVYVDGVASADVDYGTELTKDIIPDPTKDGFDFTGWTIKDANGNAYTGTTMPAFDLYYTSNWKEAVKIYTLKFLDENGDVLASYEYEEGEAVTADYPAYSKPNYTTSWSANIPEKLTADTEIGAILTPNVYAITFYNGNAQVGEAAADEDNNWTATVIGNLSNTQSHKFLGWSEDPNATAADAKYTAGAQIALTGDVTVYAVWQEQTYTVTIDANGGTIGGNATWTTSGAYGSDITYPQLTAPTGKKLIGWKDENGADVNELPKTMNAANKTYIAQWELIDVTISFNANGGEAVAPLSGKYGTTVNAPSATREGYGFQGWAASSAPDAQILYKAGEAITLTTDTTLYAIWKINTYTVTYVDGEEKTTSTVDWGTEITISSMSNTASHKFLGWSSTQGGVADSAYAAGNKVTVKADLTLYAVWELNTYTITWIVDGKSTTTTVNHGELPAFTGTPSKAENAQYTYTFAGWTPAIVEATGDASYEAEFTPVLRSYDITFVVDGQENKVVSTKYGETPVYDADGKIPEKAADEYYSYEFAGWEPALAEVTGEATYTATWTKTPIEYTIIFKDGDDIIGQIKGSYGSDVDMTQVPATEKTGYTFDGWDKEIPTTIPAENVVLTGIWTINQYTITFKEDPGFDLDDGFTYSITKNYGDPITEEDLAALNTALGSCYGYEFQYWETEGGEYTIPATMPAYDQEVTAYWDAEKHELWVYSSLNPDQQLGNGVWMWYDESYDTVEEFNDRNFFNYTDPNGEHEYLTPAGYTFNGYKFADGTDMVFPYTHTLLEDMILYAQFAPIDYTITFMDGDSEYAKVTTGYGTAITLPENPTKEGYTFAGWVNGNNEAVDLSTMPLNGMTVYATWTVDSFKLNFFASEGDATAYKTFDITFGTELTAEYVAELLAQITEPTKEGNTWNGWNTDAMPETMPASAVNVYGDWTVNTYHIYWSVVENVDDEEVDTLEQSFLYGTATTAPVYTAPEGYKVVGIEDIPSTMPAEDLYLQITIAPESYTITFDADGGSDVESITADYKSAITAPAAPTKTGHTFLGWSVDGVNVVEFPETMPVGGMNLKALWARNKVFITWIIEGKETVEEYAYGDAITAPEATKAADAKWTYKHTGWDAEIPATATENATFTAEFAEDEAVKYTVKFVNGENTVYETQIAWNGEVTLDGFTAPTEEGRTLSWTVDGNDATFPYAMTTADVTFVANWTPITYTVYYYTVDGFDNNEGPVYTVQAAYGTAFPTYTLELEGYDFDFWKEPNGTTYHELPETMPAQDLHLIGFMTPKTFTVTWLNDGDPIVESYKYGETVNGFIPEREYIDSETHLGWIDFCFWTDMSTYEEVTLPFTMPARDMEIAATNTFDGWFERPGSEAARYWHEGSIVRNSWFSVNENAEWVTDGSGTMYHSNGDGILASDITKIDDVYYAFDHNTSAFLSDYTGIYEAKNGDLYYVENGIAVANKGLVKVTLDDGHIHYYYFGCGVTGCTAENCAGEYVAQKSNRHWAAITNGYLLDGAYTTDADGVIEHIDDTSVTGIYVIDGVKYYLMDGVKVHKGLFKEGNYYYYARSSGALVVNQTYWVSGGKLNGLDLAQGNYTFDSEGRIVFAEDKNGFYFENGAWYYYVDNQLNYAGLIWCDGPEGNDPGYYYINSSCKLVTDCDYWISKNNGYMKNMTYSFDENGTMYTQEVVLKEGVYAEDGSLYYYVAGARNYAGLIKYTGDLHNSDGSVTAGVYNDVYIYVNTSGEVKNNCNYWISKTNDLMPGMSYNFDENGIMTNPYVADPLPDGDVKNGIVPENGSLYYYENGVLTYAGLIQIDGNYYYVRTSGEVVNNCDYWISKGNGLMKNGLYNFDANGVITNPRPIA